MLEALATPGCPSDPHAIRLERARGRAPYAPAVTALAPGVGPSHAPRLRTPQGREIHIWSIDLHDMGADATELLDPAELARAGRFVFAHDWRRYVAAHAWMRRILGAYLRLPPQVVRWTVNAHGKPRLLHDVLAFNLSHSADMALVAVTAGFEVGVDVEAIRNDLPDEALAAAVLTPAEHAALNACPPASQSQAFAHCWTRKEAVLKALGIGFACEPCGLNVGIGPQHASLHVAPHGASVEVASVEAPSGFAAAVAAVGGFAGTPRSCTVQSAWKTCT